MIPNITTTSPDIIESNNNTGMIIGIVIGVIVVVVIGTLLIKKGYDMYVKYEKKRKEDIKNGEELEFVTIFNGNGNGEKSEVSDGDVLNGSETDELDDSNNNQEKIAQLQKAFDEYEKEKKESDEKIRQIGKI